MKSFNDAGYFVFVVTNQAGVAHGLYDEGAVERLHRWMNAELRRSGAHVDAWRYCPFHPEAKVAAYRATHPWRKPGVGMLLDMMRQWPVETRGSFLIGDRDSDIGAAQSAGLPGHLFSGGSLAAFAARLMQQPPSRKPGESHAT